MIDKLHTFIFKLGLPICQGYTGPCFKLGSRKRLCTKYVGEEDNWRFMCKKCFDDCNGDYQDMFNDIYSGF